MFKKLMFAIICMFSVSLVCAMEMDTSSIPDSSYVVGTHLYTSPSDVTPEEMAASGYDGKFVAKYAMFGSSTAEFNNVSDIVIYYKVIGNIWIDYFKWPATVDMPDKIEITHKNGVCIDTEHCTVTREPDKFTVSFEKGNWNDEASVEVYKGATFADSNIPKVKRKVGYKFKHWGIKGNEDTAYDFSKPVTDNVTLVAVFDKIDYKVIYHTNFGTDVTQDDPTCNIDETNALAKCDILSYESFFGYSPETAGSNFIGWSKTPYKDKLLGSEEKIEDFASDEDEIHLYAIWDTNSYSLVYKGIDGTKNDKVKCKYDVVCSLDSIEPDLDTTGKVFAYWYIMEDENEKVLPSLFTKLTDVDNKEIEVFAKYKEEEVDVGSYKVLYDLNNGYHSFGNNPSKIEKDSEYGIQIINPFRNGYTFAGWEVTVTEISLGVPAEPDPEEPTPPVLTEPEPDPGESSEDDGEEENEEEEEEVPSLDLNDLVILTLHSGYYTLTLNQEIVAESPNVQITLKAKWESKKLTIELLDENDVPYTYHDDEDDTDKNVKVECTYDNVDNCKITYNPEDETEHPNDKSFEGWEHNGLIYYNNVPITNANIYVDKSSTDTIKMKAIWNNKVRYSIDYELNNGKFVDGAVPIKNYYKGDYQDDKKLVLPNSDALVRKGYAFKGWTIEPDSDEFITEIENPDADIKLYANWETISYTVEFYDGEEHLDADITCKYNQECNLGDHSSMFTNSTFLGWGFTSNQLYLADNLKVINLIDEFSLNVTDIEDETVIKLYAVRGNYYNVSYYLDGGTIVNPKDSKVIKTNVTPYSYDINVNDYGTVTKAGYRFVGWLHNGTLVDEDGIVTISQDTILVAKWQKVSTLMLHYAEENVMINVDEGANLEEDMLSSIPEDELDGRWVDNDDNIVDISDLIGKTLDSDKELYRVYTIKFYNEDGETLKTVRVGNNVIGLPDDFKANGTWYKGQTDDDFDNLTNRINNLEEELNNFVVRSDMTYKRLFKIKFEDYDGETVSSDNCIYGKKYDYSSLGVNVKSNNWKLGSEDIEDLEDYFDKNPIESNLTFIQR